MTLSPPLRVALVLIGNELLTGKVVDTNGPFAIRSLRDAGAEVGELRVISDDKAVIAAHVRGLKERFDVVITSGGVGPTHDDVTMEAVADAFDDMLETREELLELVRRVFGKDPAALRVWSRMAQVPTGCELVLDDGMRWPVHRMDNVWVLPGVPRSFERQLTALLPRFGSDVRMHLRTLYVALGEGHIAEDLRAAVQRFPAVSMGSYPVMVDGAFHTRLTLEAPERDIVIEAAEWLVALIGRTHVLRTHDGDGELMERADGSSS